MSCDQDRLRISSFLRYCRQHILKFCYTIHAGSEEKLTKCLQSYNDGQFYFMWRLPSSFDDVEDRRIAPGVRSFAYVPMNNLETRRSENWEKATKMQVLCIWAKPSE